MKKYLILTLFLCSQVFANDGLIHIKLKSALNVSVSAKTKNVKVIKTNLGYNINRAIVLTNELTTNPGMIKGTLKSKKLLDTANYKEIVVSNLVCVEERKVEQAGICSANLEIKGINRKIEKMSYVILNSNLKINFSFNLSDYNIAQKVFLFNVQNQALVSVMINLD